jgi:tRNA(His) 5'-end guanylyltransferase
MESLGDRMKAYEGRLRTEALPQTPLVVRLDGRAFSGLTQGMERPFDLRFTRTMQRVAQDLLAESDLATLSYTQSDEISVLFDHSDWRRDMWFGGRVQKLASVMASLATARFNRYLQEEMGMAAPEGLFDARVIQLPNWTEAYNYLVWRERDATKNSISMAAHQHYSQSELYGVSQDERQEMLFQAGVNWNDYPASFKRGTYFGVVEYEDGYTAEELEGLPEKHHARTDPEFSSMVRTTKQLSLRIEQLEDPEEFLTDPGSRLSHTMDRSQPKAIK